MQIGGFGGTDRFQVLSRLGSGGMGAVYHVLDRDQGSRVALKTVGEVDGDALLRFKREFRALQGLDHPNIISFGELFEADGLWFYTMELIDGTTFHEHVRTAPLLGGASTSGDDLPTSAPDRTAGDGGPSEIAAASAAEDSHAGPLGFDEARLRADLAQLASGLSALHAAGKVHRDIKPANLMVTEEGRLVILDFGLVTDLEDGIQHTDVGAMGTYSYMSPEQASGVAVDARSDWYSVGVVLFQAMTGRLPFLGKTLAALTAKLHEPAPEPSMLVRGIPQDLNDLCRDLLERDPDRRPGVAEILRRLHVEQEGDAKSPSSKSHPGAGDFPFIGRRDELAILEGGIELAAAGRATAIAITGESGIGKSELMDHFLANVGHVFPTALVLRGRCYERESVRYRSFDGIVDALSSELIRLPKDRVHELVPHGAGLLARAFPVLRRVERFIEPQLTRDVPDPQERRSRVFTAIRTLFAGIAASRPVIVALEDLQWLDDDTRSLLGELLREPDPPPIFFLTTLRTPMAEAEAALVASESLAGLPLASMHLGPLPPDEAEELASLLLGGGDSTLERARWLVRETGGHPLFLDELARHMERRPPLEEGGEVGIQLDDAIQGRVQALDPVDRRILRFLTIAGRPLRRDVLGSACELEPEDALRRCSALSLLRLLRVNGIRRTDSVELYHGRIAEALRRESGADDEASLHERIARALETSGGADVVDLATHWASAGQSTRAAEYAAEAADEAVEQLDFDRAAALYSFSLDLHPAPEGVGDRRLRARAMALAGAGRGAEAGDAFIAATDGAPEAEAIDLERRAAEQFLISGHLDRGVSAIRLVLARLRLRYPRTTLGVVLSLVWVRLRLVLRGGRFQETDDSMLRPEDRLRVDACQSIGVGLAPSYPIRGVEFYGRAMLRALRLGEPGRIATMSGIEAIQRVISGRGGRVRAFALLQRARDLGDRSHDPNVRGAIAYAEGMAAYMMGEWSEAMEAFGRAEAIYRDECQTSPAEFRTIQACSVQCLWELGEWAKFQRRVGRALKESHERGDRFTEAMIRGGLNMQVLCMSERIEQEMDEAEFAASSWSSTGFDVQEYQNILHGAVAELYLGDVAAAARRMEQGYRRYRYTLLWPVQLMRGGAIQIRGLVALAHAAQEPGQRKRWLRVADRCARRMAREDAFWAHAGGHLIRGCSLVLKGKRTEGLLELDEAIRELDRCRMAGRAAAARWAKGALIGGVRGRELVDQARGWMRSERVVDPDRFVATLAPILYASDLLEIPLRAPREETEGPLSSLPPFRSSLRPHA